MDHEFSLVRQNQTPSSQPTILVVDNHAGVLKMLALALGSFGFSVEAAATGTHALDIYRRATIDLVLMDVHMPDMDGPETLANLKKINPKVICCFMSGDRGRYTLEDLLGMGAVGFIHKPFRLEELRQMIWQARSQNEANLPAPNYLPARDIS